MKKWIKTIAILLILIIIAFLIMTIFDINIGLESISHDIAPPPPSMPGGPSFT